MKFFAPVIAAIVLFNLSLAACLADAMPDIQSNGPRILRSRDWHPTKIALAPKELSLAAPTPANPGKWAGNPAKFFTGAFVGFLGHESGHLIANYAMDTDPYLKSVNYGPIPFFTIEPGRPLTHREHYITASAGFNAENIIDEFILIKHPNLNAEDKPFLKGIVTFNFWLNVGYAATAFAGTGPDERDTKGMADALGWNERWVGAMILVPTALDTYRYKHPDSKWAATASRASKLAMIALTLTADN